MEQTELIPAEEFCIHHSISLTFVHGLHEAGLIEVVSIEERKYIHAEQAGNLEKLVRLHAELGINQAGIEAVAHLLDQVEQLQVQVKNLSARLRLYEDN